MNAERLLAHYENIADAPDATARLRRFILDLAVRGKLVPQEPNDEPASELLKRIAKTRGGKRQKELPEINADELGDLPRGWHAAPLIALGDWAIGAGFPKNEQGEADGPYFFLKVSDMNLPGNEKFITVANNFIDDAAAKRMRAAIHPPGTIIFPKIGGAIATNKRRILTRGSAIDNNCLGISFSAAIDNEWAYLLLTTLDFSRYQAGTAVPALQQGSLAAIPVAVPPLAEQHRIIAKVDELMGLCDRLEAARAGDEAVRDRLASASLARLNAPDPETFQADARFALDALPTLTTRPDQIKALRQTILNLAVRGKLVSQDANDEPAKNLLARARASKAALRTARRIGRDEDPEFSESLGETSSPQYWSWAHLADFALVLGGKRLPAGANFSAEPTDHIYIRVTDMKGGTISADNIKYVSTDVQRQITKYTIDKEDIYVTIAGTIGEVGAVPPFFDGHNLTENAAKIVFREIDKAFLIMVLRSEDVQTQFAEKTKQMAQPKLALKRILGARVPLPPLAEQQRIVATVDALMALCDRLEASLDQTAATRRRLLDALLAEVLAPADDLALEAAE